MRIGPLRERVTFQEVTETQSGSGGIVPSWAKVATVWARVDYEKGREYFNANQVAAEESAMIEIRTRSDIVPKMRAVWRDQTFNIHAVLPSIRKKRMIEIMVSRENRD